MNRRLLCQVLLCFVLASGLGCSTGTQSTPAYAESTREALAVLRQAETVDYPAVGFAGERTATYDAFASLSESATTDQLVGLLDDSNAVVATYAFWALSDRLDPAALFPLMMKQLRNETQVKMFAGCIKYTATVGDEALDMMELTPKQDAQVLDFLLTQENNLSARGSYLESRQIPARYYDRVRALAQKPVPEALVALARYQREADIGVIVKNLNEHPFHALRAISYFPHERFLPHLEAFQKPMLAEKYWSTTQREFYSTASQYRSPRAIAMLAVPFDEAKDVPMRSYHLRFVAAAVEREADAFHDPIRDLLHAQKP